MNILIAEDNKVTLRLLNMKLRSWGHETLLAENGLDAWAGLGAFPADIVITDWMMPVMDGLELCRRIRKGNFDRYIYLIIVTAMDEKSGVVTGLEAGADDYLRKPIDFDELRARVDIGVRIVTLEQELDRRYRLLKTNYFQTIRMFAGFIEQVDKKLGAHSRRVGELVVDLAGRRSDFSHDDLEHLEAAALLHDIGMVGMPKELLRKTHVEMNSDEMKLYRTHPLHGEIILNEIEFLRPVARLVRAHHEQFNGRGFPDGVRGDELPFSARILSAAVFYDDLIHKWHIPLEKIPDRLNRARGYRIESNIVDHLLDINMEYIQKEEAKDAVEVPLSDIQPGMVLAKDIRRDTGALVMPMDAEIMAHSMLKLKRFQELGCIENTVHVYRQCLNENPVQLIRN